MSQWNTIKVTKILLEKRVYVNSDGRIGIPMENAVANFFGMINECLRVDCFLLIFSMLFRAL